MPSLYTVQCGDTLSYIAQLFGTTLQLLSEVNYISYPYRVYPGQKLIIPSETTLFPKYDRSNMILLLLLSIIICYMKILGYSSSIFGL